MADTEAAWFLQQVALLQCGPRVGGKQTAPHWTEAAGFPALQIGRSDFYHSHEQCQFCGQVFWKRRGCAKSRA